MRNKKSLAIAYFLLVFSSIFNVCLAQAAEKSDFPIDKDGLTPSSNSERNDQRIDNLIHLASDYRNQGEPGAAIEVLTQALKFAENTNNLIRLSLIYGGFSDVYLLSRQLEHALRSAESSVEFSSQSTNRLIQATSLNYYGNVLVAQQYFDKALATYQKGIELAKQQLDSSMIVKLYLNILHVYLATDSSNETVEVVEQTLREIKTIPNSGEKSNLLVALGHLVQRLHFKNTENINQSSLLAIAYSSFTEALNVSKRIGDIRGQSFALGHLGELYTIKQRYKEAEQLFRQATFFSNQIDAPDLTARWWWQRGRLLKNQYKILKAEAAYGKSLTHLITIQSTMVYGYRGNPQSFRETVGVIYLEYLDILLDKASKINDRQSQRKVLIDVRNIMEKFKTVKLKNYFQDNCVTELQARNSAKNIDDELTVGTAILYPIIFSDRVTLLLSFADGSLKQFNTKLKEEDLDKAVKIFHRELDPTANPRRLRIAGKVLYNWLIAPLESELTQNKVKTLVVVPDGILGTIPFAALHDGNDFLVNKYAFVTSPGLSLTLNHQGGLGANESQALLNGLSKNVQQFEQLPYVQNELQKISEQLKNTTQLVDGDFKKHSVENHLKLKPYTTVLFASHAELKANPKESFILTYDDKISLNDLSRFLKIGQYRENPVNLLVLSACNTARGDERAAYGLAGVAVKAGVSSVLASLWAVNDESTSELIPQFFKNLKKAKLSKAIALQQAQKSLLKSANYSHPFHWASFVLFGNWL